MTRDEESSTEVNPQSSFLIDLVRRIFVYTRAATARKLRPKPSAKAKTSPKRSECSETELWLMFARDRGKSERLFHTEPTLLARV